MAENDFLPFAASSSANVLSQSDYAALTALASGFESGVAKSAAVNKVLRQSSIMAAALAAFISDSADVDVIDDGTTDTIEANFLVALKAKLASLNGSTSNRFSVAPATAATDAVQLQQVGQALGGTPSLTSGAVSPTATTITLTDEYVIVASAVGATPYRIANFSQMLNTAAIGLGGLDTGTATANGFLAIYASYNPSTGAVGIFGQMASATAKMPKVYAGTNATLAALPSALLTIVPMNTTTGVFRHHLVQGKRVGFTTVAVLNTTSPTTAATALSIASQVPYNAVISRMSAGVYQTTVGSGVSMNIGASSSLLDAAGVIAAVSNQSSQSSIIFDMLITQPSTAYYQMASTVGGQFSISVRGYELP